MKKAPCEGLLLLPKCAASKKLRSTLVIDFQKAKKRLRPPPLRPYRIITALDQAERFRALLDAGSVNQAGVARLYGLTRARVTQLLNLLKLHPDILAYLRALQFVGHGRPPSERSLRPLTALSADEQLHAAAERLPGFRHRGCRPASSGW